MHHFNAFVTNAGNGFRVKLMLQAFHDDPYETLLHPKLFRDKAKAEALADKVNQKGKFKAAHWFWYPTDASAFPFMHIAPVTTLEK